MARRRLKIITLGSCETGKSALIKRFCEHRFERRYYKTIGVDYGSTNVKILIDDNDNDVVIDFFDLSGDKNHVEIRNEFYHDVHGCLLVYDMGNMKSFEELEKWLQEGKRYGLDCDNVPIVLSANKKDLELFEVISNDKKIEFAKKYGMEIYETSALDGSNVTSMFCFLFREALLRIDKTRR